MKESIKGKKGREDKLKTLFQCGSLAEDLISMGEAEPGLLEAGMMLLCDIILSVPFPDVA